jgi:hypothetical protein
VKVTSDDEDDEGDGKDMFHKWQTPTAARDPLQKYS